MPVLEPVERIKVTAFDPDLFLVAGSFEPRSVRAAQLLQGDVDRAVVFSYDDTLDIESGRQNTREIQKYLREKSRAVDVLRCQLADPYSVIKALHSFVTQEQFVGEVRSVILDASCFTKLHLLLLLRFLSDWLAVESCFVCYTQPLVYPAAFGNKLSYGIRDTVYLPYSGMEHKGDRTGMIALLGHEPHRLERIVQEIEPDRCVVLVGEPGFTPNMATSSWRANAGLIRRAEYDGRYRLAHAQTDDIEGCVEVLVSQLHRLRKEGCRNVYLVPLGTKLQAIAIDELRRQDEFGHLSLAYAMPDRFERRSYSQGFGKTLATTIEYQQKRSAGWVPIPRGGKVITDDDVNALRDELGI